MPLFFICQICCQKQPTKFIKGKQSRPTLYQSLLRLLFVLHTLPVCEVFTCNCLHSGEQHKFLSSPQPARPLSTCLTQRGPVHQSNRSQTRSLSHQYDTYIPPLVQPRKSQNCILRLGTQRTEPLLNHRWPRICPSSVSPLPSCTVRCHL